MHESPGCYEFNGFLLIPSESRLLHRGTPIPLAAKALDTLLVLVSRQGRLVEKADFINIVWGGAFVEEGNIAGVISVLRRALGDDPHKPRYIETVQKRGYRFVAEVRNIEVTEDSAAGAELASKSRASLGPRFQRDGGGSPIRTLAIGMGVAALLLVCFVSIELIARNRASLSAPSAPISSAVRQSTRLDKQDTQDAEARIVYSQGRQHIYRGTQELRRSIQDFQQAVLKDPQYAKAYSGFAEGYARLAGSDTEAAADDYPLAKAAAVRAVQLDGTLAESHASLGTVYFRYEWDCPRAEHEFQRSIELNPNYTQAYIDFASCLGSEGRFEEALELARRAVDLNPSSAVANTEVGYIYYLSRRYEESISVLRHAVDLDPSYALPHMRLALGHLLKGDYPDALRESAKADELSPADPHFDGLSGYIEARSGKQALARKRQASLIERSHEGYTPAFSIALISIGLGEHSEALGWLEKAFQERSASLMYAGVDPLFDSERSSQQFAALLTRVDHLLPAIQQSDSAFSDVIGIRER
jgi:DNA-binding winged helix-turn-helix (wHTH) protein/Flp pilus assembly protein TadD